MSKDSFNMNIVESPCSNVTIVPAVLKTSFLLSDDNGITWSFYTVRMTLHISLQGRFATSRHARPRAVGTVLVPLKSLKRAQ